MSTGLDYKCIVLQPGVRFVLSNNKSFNCKGLNLFSFDVSVDVSGHWNSCGSASHVLKAVAAGVMSSV